ncbi:MAG: hypothetical protein LBV46_01295, partial [Bacteroidales bacterium]|nr:hypothetical protein [Bacteroidales bacterium]
SNQSIATSDQSIATSDQSIATSTDNIATSDNTKKYFRKNILETMIIEVCGDFTPLEEIATTVQRDIRYLNNFIIPQMVKEGKLERLFSEKNHPNQKYKAK